MGKKDREGGRRGGERDVSKRIKATHDEEYEEDRLPEALSRKILNQARQQQTEIAEEGGEGPSVIGNSGQAELTFEDVEEVSDEEEHDGEYVEMEEEVEEFTMEDEEALKAFMSGALSQRRTIADLIMEKLQEQEAAPGAAPKPEEGKVRIDPKIVECYTGVGRMLRSYRSGKLPKAFKIIPALTNWEEVLYYTEPDMWSPNAVRQATRLFASNLSPKMAQRFYNLVLLPRIREEIAEKKKLHWSLYQALRKSCYKPGAFYKGIVLPLCESGDCTLREATIVGSVIRQVSIPFLHSSAALLKLAEMRYSGANSIFMKIIIEKKYALPYRVLDGVVQHFCSFATESRRLPVLWHNTLLAFAQRYKTDLNAAQLESLKTLLRLQTHDLITPEIRSQLFAQQATKPHDMRKREVAEMVATQEADIVME